MELGLAELHRSDVETMDIEGRAMVQLRALTLAHKCCTKASVMCIQARPKPPIVSVVHVYEGELNCKGYLVDIG